MKTHARNSLWRIEGLHNDSYANLWNGHMRVLWNGHMREVGTPNRPASNIIYSVGEM